VPALIAEAVRTPGTSSGSATGFEKGNDAVVPIAVMLATLTQRRDFGSDWLLERKFDGERCIARKEGEAVGLESRTGKDLTGTYPEVRAALEAQRTDRVLLDGEVVACDCASKPRERSESMSSRTTLMFRFRVHEYEAWKAVFDGHEEARVRHGAVGHRVLRDAQNALALTVLVEFASLGGAKGFVEEISLVYALGASGVEGGAHGGSYHIDYLEELDTVAVYAQ
jgi:ATP dependent DNA ligase domain